MRLDTMFGFQIRHPRSVVMMDSMLDASPSWMGLPVYSNPLVVRIRRWTTIEPMPIPKRRRRWRLVRHARPEPSAIVACDPVTGRQCIYAHPDVVDAMRRAAATEDTP